jgi:hypothetical protein
MTFNTTTSKPSTKQICAIFHDSIINNNGEIHMSQFEEPNRPDDFATDDDLKDQNKQNINEDLFNEEDNNLLLNAEELDELEDTTYHDNSIKNSTNESTSTNDNDKKLPADDTSTSNFKPSNQEDIISKARYRYGRKGSMIPSTFKKYQAPFKTKQNNSNPPNNGISNPTDNEKQNEDINQLLLSILQQRERNKNNNKKDNENTNTNNIEKNHEIINDKSIRADENSTNKTDNKDNTNHNHDNTYTTIPTPPHTRNQTLTCRSPIINKITPSSTGSINHNQRTPVTNHHDKNHLQREHHQNFKTTEADSDQLFLHRNNTEKIPQTKRQTPIHQLTNYLQTSDDSKVKIPNLTPELESLKTVIMSQHNALSQHIIELGNTCLYFTNLIETKKDSAIKLIDEGRIPRSLRLKCELTTSPSYENNPDFILLKKELQDAVSLFTETGLEIMKKWSLINIQLLIKDKCNNILKKAINILDGLYSYWEYIIGPANWPNNIEKNILLLILKIYFETDYISNNTDIIEYFELSPNEILLLASKTTTKNHDDIHNQKILTSIDQLYLEFSQPTPTQLSILKETITAFHDILKATTIDLWEYNLTIQREIEASQKLKTKMDAERISSATVATANSINKAIETIDLTNNTNETTHLRLLNLEKRLIQQNQTSNEILNHLKKQKNSKGSQQEPLTAPTNPFTTKQNNIVDLTMAHSQGQERGNLQHYSQQNGKRRRIIQWDNTQNKIKEYNPISTPKQMFSHSPLLHPPSPNPFQLNPFRSTNIQKTHTSRFNNNYNTTSYSTNQKSRDAKYKGGRRGMPPRYKNN